MPLKQFSRRELLSRPSRAILTFLSIAIGVGAVVAVLLSISTTHEAQRDMLRTMAGKADLEVLADDSKGFDLSILKTIRETAGVKTAVPSLKRFAKLIRGDTHATAQVLGIDPKIDQLIRDYQITSGSTISKRGDAMLDSSFAESLKLKVGDKFRLLAHGGMRTYEVIGLVTSQGTTSVSLNNGIYLSLPDAISAFGSGAKIDQVHLIVNSGSKVADAITNLRAALPLGVTVQVPPTRNQMAEETMFATENGLRLAIAFAILIAVFIIYNTFQMSVGQRRKQLGILRSIGATRGQVGRMILREALWISVVASVAGCAMGIYGASFLTSATEQLMQVQLPGVRLSWIPILTAVAIGIGVALLGAILPARRASFVEPMEAIRNLELADNERVKKVTFPLSCIFFGIGAVLLFLSICGWLPIGGDVVGVVFILLACVLMIPTILDFVSRSLSRAIRSTFGVEAELAQRQLTRQLGRSSLTIGVLFVAISSSVGMTGNILDNVANVHEWYSRTIVGDFFVRANTPNFTIGGNPSMPDGIVDQLRKVDGINSLDSIRYLSVRSSDHTIMLIVQDFVGKSAGYFDLVAGSEESALSGLTAGEVVIGTVLAQRLGLHAGDPLPLEGPNGTEPFQIVAITNEYLAGGLTAYMQRDVAEKRLGVIGVDAYVVQADDAKLATVQRDLQTLCQKNSLVLESYAQVIHVINRTINGVIASLWMLLALGSVIAAMGLINTLTISILEQTREIGMLRVVAMTRRQVRKMILAEAALLGVIALVPGAVCGAFISYVIGLSSSRILGHQIAFHFRPGMILACLATGFGVVLIASLIPAERAARLKLAKALRYE